MRHEPLQAINLPSSMILGKKWEFTYTTKMKKHLALSKDAPSMKNQRIGLMIGTDGAGTVRQVLTGLTGEHGVGVEKRDLMEYQFDPPDLDRQQQLKCAFDPAGLLNPGKVFPKLHRCAEMGRMHVHRGRLPFPEIPRF